MFEKGSACCCFSVRSIVIFLLFSNIVFNVFGVEISLFYYNKLSLKNFFDSDTEMSMVFIFITIETFVLFAALISTTKNKSSMLTSSIAMLLLESYHIIYFAVRAHYRDTWHELWKSKTEQQVINLFSSWNKEMNEKDLQLAYTTELILIYVAYFLLLLFKLYTALVVHRFKIQQKEILWQNIIERKITPGKNSWQRRTNEMIYAYTPMDGYN